MLVNFTKMHGLGNDFVVIDAITQSVRLHSAHIKKIANRNFGIGCDQVLIVDAPMAPEQDIYYRIFNSNGYEAEQCGNGARCVAQFVLDNGLINKQKIVAGCLAGQITMEVIKDGLINIDFGTIATKIQTHKLSMLKLPNELFALSLGNPHGICVVPNLSEIPICSIGREISTLNIFPHQANITFMQIVDSKNVLLGTYERGAGLTLSCGSGACAAIIVGQHIGLLDTNVTAKFNHGELNISFNKKTNNLQMSGPTESVFVGKFRI